jgi:hypothetical protein
MKFFIDSSALIKRYVEEIGSEKVDDLFTIASEIILSPITKIEIHSTIDRLKCERLLSNKDYSRLTKEIHHDFKYFSVLPFNHQIELQSIHLIEKHHLRTLDSIQLASCLSQKDSIDSFVVSDRKLKMAAKKENCNFIDPTES